MRSKYKVTVGEVGNDIGHTSEHYCADDDGARRAARRMAAGYSGDGWWTVEDDNGRPVGHGGRRQM